MAANNDVIVQKTTDSTQFLFRGVANYKPRKSQPALVVPLPNTSSANALLFRIFGQSETITFSFALFDDDTDVSNGTHSSTVKTVVEQIRYLKDTFYSAEWNVSWTMWDRLAIYDSGDSVSCVITNLDFDQKTSPALVTGSITLQRGNAGDLS